MQASGGFVWEKHWLPDFTGTQAAEVPRSVVIGHPHHPRFWVWKQLQDVDFSKKRGPAFEITWCNEISYNIPCTYIMYHISILLCIHLVYLCHITCTTTVLLQYFCLQMFEASEVTTAYNISVHQHTPNLKENLIKWPDNPVHDLCSSSSFLLDFWFRPLAPSVKILTFFPDVETIYRMIRGFNECLWRTSHVELLVTASNASSTRRSLQKTRLRDAGWFVQKSS